MDKITETYHTLIYILSIEQNTNLSVALNKKESASGDNIWEVADTKCVTGKDGEFLGGTLNHIIIKLTSEQDSKFESSFITTYQSFTTPWILLEKLHQRFVINIIIFKRTLKFQTLFFRYHIPKDKKLDPQICLRIKLRVCVVLQHWIRIQFHDFDPKIIEKLENFIVDIEKDQKSMADKLRREVEKKSKELKRSRRASMAIDPYLQLKVPEGGFSPMKLVLESTESEISRQLTMIEFKLFAKIQVIYYFKI